MFQRGLDGRGEELLRWLDSYLAQGTRTTGALVAIFSALRGPDAADLADVKTRTTAVIRAKAFPAAGVQFGNTSQAQIIVIKSGDRAMVGEHFLSHVKEAAKALGIPVQDETATI